PNIRNITNPNFIWGVQQTVGPSDLEPQHVLEKPFCIDALAVGN
ncbi:hypothetical protein SKA34_00822, partial [Photobacterium sp. SKA34]